MTADSTGRRNTLATVIQNDNIIMKLNKKDILELVGIAAIVASLAFVGMQLRQSQNIAIAEGYAWFFSTRIEVGNSIKEHVDIWRRGTSGGDLTVEESAIFAILVNQVNEYSVMSYLISAEIEGDEAAEFSVINFASFLYQNPGARRVWANRESNLIRYRRLLIDGGAYSSSWSERVNKQLARLDQEKPPLEKEPLFIW